MDLDTDPHADLADPVGFAQALMRRPSVTPIDAGALDTLQGALDRLGFSCRRYRFGEVDNLYAELGAGGANLCFAGHTDVVPVGDADAWTVDPFAAEIRGGALYGRGAVDMKGSIGAWVAAVARYLRDHGPPPGRLSFLITGDEEGPAVDGTKKLLAAILSEGVTLTHCLVGEPTSEQAIADVVKNGRRGSLNARIVATGRQGHVAYPAKAANPVPALLDLLHAVRARPLDDGAQGFQPSNLEVTSVDVANPAHNVIPARAEAKFNIRFNTRHTGAELEAWIGETANAVAAAHPGVAFALDLKTTGEPFYCPPDRFAEVVSAAVRAETGAEPAFTTGGGTSDARFIHKACPCIELGLKNETAHKIDEHAALSEIEALSQIYYRVISGYFS